ncbi:MAG: glycerol-3-phosphate dehydrogenase [Pirellulaceae bacterium]|nr:MAG: glycerol-3-phosphate dehydrogenase [Pirellulaceae bacterium]GIW95705.1 MAG: glycerol-3-phosphate dehydrogenase [Pirellulaceae bacterium]
MLLEQATAGDVWDILVVGGGATGLGCAVDAALRGYRTLLVERNDFAQGTSSRSTKLIHGGLRYLAQGQWRLVREALAERAWLLNSAPHLVHPLGFIVPCYGWYERWLVGTGLAVYDWLGGAYPLPRSCALGRAETLERLPGLKPDRLRAGLLYYDGQFDDARLAILLVRTAVALGACLLNYVEAEPRTNSTGRVVGLRLHDRETGRQWEVSGRCVINATGIFADQFRRKVDRQAHPLLTYSQGSHLVLAGDYLGGSDALLIPRTRDGRVLFAIPWYGRLLVGTTDVPIQEPVVEPQAAGAEIDYLIGHLSAYLRRPMDVQDIRSVFAGQRPLVYRPHRTTARLAREHLLVCWPEGMITITGGKWTTFRRMAQRAVDAAMHLADLPVRPCRTDRLQLYSGDQAREALRDYGAMPGADTRLLDEWIARTPRLALPLDPRLPYRLADVVWSVRFEMARTVEDVLARRTRALFLDAEAAEQAAPDVARILADELARPAAWQEQQVQSFKQLAQQYRPLW